MSNTCLHPRTIVQESRSVTAPQSDFRTCPERPPIGVPDHNMLWFAPPGWPGCGLYFHEVIEKSGVAAFREVYIMGLYRKLPLLIPKDLQPIADPSS